MCMHIYLLMYIGALAKHETNREKRRAESVDTFLSVLHVLDYVKVFPWTAATLQDVVKYSLVLLLCAG